MPDGFGQPSKAPPRRRRTVVVAVAGAVAVALTAATVATMSAASAATQDAATQDASTQVVQAEAFADQSGAVVETTVDTGGGQDVGYLMNGDWLRYDGVTLSATVNVAARVASAGTGGDGTIELHTGSVTGPLLAQFAITSTGGWQAWATQTAAGTTQATGPQSVFAVMKAAGSRDFVNINWFSFGTTGGTAPASPTVTGTSPTATPTPTTTPPAPGWVNVDQAKWQAQLAAFNALPMDPAPANAVRVSEFNASCQYSHSKKDDPIVFPAQPGASHMHSFLGNDSTDAFSTTDSLLANAGSTCKPAEDLSAYWIPTLYEHGVAVEPKGVTVYYGSRLTAASKTVPFPQGFRMIAGNAKLQVPTPAGSVNQFYCAGPGGETGRSADGNWPVCADGASLLFQLVFPDCWDGQHLDSPDHKSHVAFTYDGTCSGAFPVAIPSVSFVIAYPTHGTTDGFLLASGLASSMHGDVFEAWDNTAQAHRVKNCIVQKAKCSTAGTF